VSKAIIVAAGRGKRLGIETDEIPKCMVKVAGRSILHWQLQALASAGVDDVVIVRGYRGELIAAPGQTLRFIENPEWPRNNILASLMYAAAEMPGGFFFSYSDIVFAPAVAAQLAAETRAPEPDVALIVDRRWQDAYEGRTEHPVSEAELARVDATPAGPAVTRVGKRVVPSEDAAGEFIGLARFSAAGATALQAVWARALREGGLEAPFGRAATLRNAYVSDALNAMVDDGVRLAPVFIDGTWREIDTQQDLASAERSAALWG
jgi:L-glutamine-phosphate cytidylyltransferase